LGLKVIIYDYSKEPPELLEIPATDSQTKIFNSLPKNANVELALKEDNFEPITTGEYLKLADNIPVPEPTTGIDKFGIPYFHKSKPNGYVLEQGSDPANQEGFDHIDADFTVSGNVITMKPNGPTSFGVGRNIRKFKDSIGGCLMNFAETTQRGYACFPDDVRDIEFKCIMSVKGIGSHGLSISTCTGHHDDGPNGVCSQGFSYMFTIDDVQANPVKFKFKKEMYHVSYHDSPEGTFTHPSANFKIDGRGFVGLGVCRYNRGDRVVLEGWFNPNPEQDLKNWIMIKRIEDFKGKGWGNDGDKCPGGYKDQIGLWSGPQNRLKTNATQGTVDFKCISFREIVE